MRQFNYKGRFFLIKLIVCSLFVMLELNAQEELKAQDYEVIYKSSYIIQVGVAENKEDNSSAIELKKISPSLKVLKTAIYPIKGVKIKSVTNKYFGYLSSCLKTIQHNSYCS